MNGVDPARLMRFVLEMRQAGVTDARALSALERTPRGHYAPPHLQGLALDDVGLPLAHAQAMTKPSLIGRVLTALDIAATHSVLEIGCGSGFQAACIASMARKVTTLDRWRDLVTDARERMGTARLMHVAVVLADGCAGYGADAPYDRIVFNVAIPALPADVLDQLAPGGVIVAPIGDDTGQRLTRYRDRREEDWGAVRFAPLEPGLGGTA